MSSTDVHSPDRSLLFARLTVGLIQGLALFGLVHWGDELGGGLAAGYVALLMVAALVPAVVLGGMGVLRRPSLVIWTLIAAAVVGGLGLYQAAYWAESANADLPPPPMIGAMLVGLFIAHGLVLAGDAERRWVASYDRYFDVAWKDAVRLALVVAFVGALWLILGLGALLFNLIGLKQFGRLISEPAFIFPVTAVVLALAVHLTDIRAGLVRGVRTLALTLLSWLLPLMTLLAAGFLAALPFTGLQPLWSTQSAAAILLTAAAALIVLVNAAYQEGERADFPPRTLKWAARTAAVLLTPLVAIAAYGVALRTTQYGLTPARVVSMACLLVGGAYALGYLAAALGGGPWMKRLEATNIAVAGLVLAVLLALLSPLADPGRLSVADQVGRLKSGKVAPEQFDYAFLRFGSGRYGREALDRLIADPPGPAGKVIAARAAAAKARTSRYELPTLPTAESAKFVALAAGETLPAGFLAQTWAKGDEPFAGCEDRSDCAAVVRDMDGDGVSEVIVLTWNRRSIYRQQTNGWARAGLLAGESCATDAAAVRAGKVAVEPPAPWRDLVIDGRRLVVEPLAKCPAASAKAGEAKMAAEIRRLTR